MTAAYFIRHADGFIEAVWPDPVPAVHEIAHELLVEMIERFNASRDLSEVQTLGDVLDVLADMKTAVDDPYVMGVLAACEDIVEAS